MKTPKLSAARFLPIISIIDPMKNKLFKNKYLQNTAAVIAALFVWQIAALCIGEKLILASPIDVIRAMGVIIKDDIFLPTLFFSFWRILSGFLIGSLLGALLALIASRSSFTETLLRPYMAAMKAVPVASFIIIALIAFSSEYLSAFISFLMVLPIVYTNILSGLKTKDKKMEEMAEVFSIPERKKLFYITLPRLKPHIISSASVSIGLAWKAGVAAEVIGVPDGSIGEALYEAKIYLDSPELLAWTVFIVILSVLFEKLFIALIRLVFRLMERI